MPQIYLFTNCAGLEIRYLYSTPKTFLEAETICQALNNHTDKSLTEYRVVDE